MKKHKWLWLLIGGLFLLGMAFWFLNFRTAVSDTQAVKNIITTGLGEGLPLPVQRKEKISIFLNGNSLLDQLLPVALEVEMQKASFVEIETVLEPAQVYPNPVMVIKIDQPVMVWTPFFATSQVSVKASYSSTGEAIFVEEPPITIDNKNGPALTMFAEYKIQDHSWGLISRPGYHQILANYLAQNITASLKGLYQE